MVKNPGSGSVNRKHPPSIDTGDQHHVVSCLLHAVEGIRHGSVHIHIQDGKIVQIDRISKIRLSE